MNAKTTATQAATTTSTGNLSNGAKTKIIIDKQKGRSSQNETDKIVKEAKKYETQNE